MSTPSPRCSTTAPADLTALDVVGSRGALSRPRTPGVARVCTAITFRGTLDARAVDVTPETTVAAATAIAGCVAPDRLNAAHVVPSVFDPAAAVPRSKHLEQVGEQVGELSAAQGAQQDERVGA